MLERLRGRLGLFRDTGGPAESLDDVVATLPEQTTTGPIIDADLLRAQGDKESEAATREWLESQKETP